MIFDRFHVHRMNRFSIIDDNDHDRFVPYSRRQGYVVWNRHRQISFEYRQWFYNQTNNQFLRDNFRHFLNNVLVVWTTSRKKRNGSRSFSWLLIRTMSIFSDKKRKNLPSWTCLGRGNFSHILFLFPAWYIVLCLKLNWREIEKEKRIFSRVYSWKCPTREGRRNERKRRRWSWIFGQIFLSESLDDVNILSEIFGMISFVCYRTVPPPPPHAVSCGIW